MPLTSLIYKNVQETAFKTSDKKQIIWSFDTILSENHTSNATITDREVESVVSQDINTINDHSVLSPETVTIVGIVSETPITLVTAIVGGALGALVGNNTNFGVNLVSGVLGGAVVDAVQNGIGESKAKGTRTSNAYEVLQGLQKSRAVFHVQTLLKSYDEMMIQSLTVDKNAELGKDAKYTCVLKKIRIVRSEIVSIDPALLAADTSSKAQETKNQGKKQSGAASAKTEEKSSALYKLYK